MSRHIVIESIRRQQQAVNSSQQWQYGRSTRHNTVFQPPVNSSYDFGLWRVDWQPNNHTEQNLWQDHFVINL